MSEQAWSGEPAVDGPRWCRCLHDPIAGITTQLRAHMADNLEASPLTRDRDAVEAALHLPWSNGPVEGQVHRLKLIKRQMYGRASFDLLRLRVLQKV